MTSESLSAPSASASLRGTRWGKPQLLVPAVVGVVVLAFSSMSFGRAVVSTFAAAVLLVLATIDV